MLNELMTHRLVLTPGHQAFQQFLGGNCEITINVIFPFKIVKFADWLTGWTMSFILQRNIPIAHKASRHIALTFAYFAAALLSFSLHIPFRLGAQNRISFQLVTERTARSAAATVHRRRWHAHMPFDRFPEIAQSRTLHICWRCPLFDGIVS